MVKGFFLQMAECLLDIVTEEIIVQLLMEQQTQWTLPNTQLWDIIWIFFSRSIRHAWGT